MLTEDDTADGRPPGEIVFLLDVDNTLLDNDGFQAELGARIEEWFGVEHRQRYWQIFEDLRAKFGVADYLGSLQAFRGGVDDDPRLLQMSQFLLEFPFPKLLFPGALPAIAHLRAMGLPVVLSDGDVVFQPRKIQHSGIWDAVQGAVLIYLHKEKVMDHVQKRYPAPHYVVVDDKPNLLAAMKLVMREKLTTVFVRQGHYALTAGSNSVTPPPDRVIERIGDLTALNLSDFKVPP
jgi:FMN phosphatase YigB (HAD superfamily)